MDENHWVDYYVSGTLVHLARCEIRLGRSSSNQIPVNSLIGLGRIVRPAHFSSFSLEIGLVRRHPVRPRVLLLSFSYYY